MNFDAFLNVFLILLNFGWMVNLAMSIFLFFTKFLIFRHPWHPWVCIRNHLKSQFETDISNFSYSATCPPTPTSPTCSLFNTNNSHNHNNITIIAYQIICMFQMFERINENIFQYIFSTIFLDEVESLSLQFFASFPWKSM